jgi:hypothetical protein
MALINDDVPNGGGPLRAAGSFGRRALAQHAHLLQAKLPPAFYPVGVDPKCNR